MLFADGNSRIWIRENMLLSTPSLYPLVQYEHRAIKHLKHTSPYDADESNCLHHTVRVR